MKQPMDQALQILRANLNEIRTVAEWAEAILIQLKINNKG